MTETSAQALPELECDLVMKGGVTSGIIYPAAIAAIAKDYRLRAIGGTSAGAIGAAAAAAMEFGRRSGRNPDALNRLACLAQTLGKTDTKKTPLLLRLFAPDPETSHLFHMVMTLKGAAGTGGLRAVALHFLSGPLAWSALVVGLLMGLLLFIRPQDMGWSDAVFRIGFMLAVIPLLTLIVAWWQWKPILLRDIEAIAANGFGFCSGMASHDPSDAPSNPSLSGWLHDQFQVLAGLGPNDPPLTFGDLWAASRRRSEQTREQAIDELRATSDGRLETAPRDIDLALVASDLSRALSVQLPFMRPEERLFARLSDLQALFPAPIVAWMKDMQRSEHPLDALEGLDLHGIDPQDIIRLPFPEDIPVLFGVRMSLSFPFLFRAVRLYVRRRCRNEDGSAGQTELAELWLADGGITSNFPIHLFDAPLPTRPTFCLNLLYHDDEFAPEEADERGALPADAEATPEELVFMLRTNKGRLSTYSRLKNIGGLNRLGQFGWRVFATAQQWGDNHLIDVPGYRDRIVHVRMREDEGGFNFDMGAKKIEDLESRGKRAGEVIAARFHPDTMVDPLYPRSKFILNWANHRFVRFRSFLSALEVSAAQFAGAWDADIERSTLSNSNPKPVLPSLLEITKEHRPQGPKHWDIGYPFKTEGQAALAEEMVKSLKELAKLRTTAAAKSIDYYSGKPSSPRPKALLHLRPPGGADPGKEGR